MIVMHSIFQEQLDREQVALHQGLEQADNSNAEAVSYLPRPEQFRIGPEEYIEQLARIKAAVKIPVVASLNGRTRGGWVDFARQIEVAGAAALELNIYDPVLDLDRDAASVEKEAEEVVRAVCKTVSIPVAVKLSPFYTSFGPLRPAPRGRRRQGPRALQPLLSARHRRGDPRGDAHPQALDLR